MYNLFNVISGLIPPATWIIRSYEDVDNIDLHARIRLNPIVAQELKINSATDKIFAWKVCQQLYKKSELVDCNYTGQRGKRAISPRRKEAIQATVNDFVGPHFIPKIGEAINVGIRNMISRRKE